MASTRDQVDLRTFADAVVSQEGRAMAGLNVSLDLLNRLAEILPIPMTCCGIELRVMLDEVPELVVHQRVLNLPDPPQDE